MNERELIEGHNTKPFFIKQGPDKSTNGEIGRFSFSCRMIEEEGQDVVEIE